MHVIKKDKKYIQIYEHIVFIILYISFERFTITNFIDSYRLFLSILLFHFFFSFFFDCTIGKQTLVHRTSKILFFFSFFFYTKSMNDRYDKESVNANSRVKWFSEITLAYAPYSCSVLHG